MAVYVLDRDSGRDEADGRVGQGAQVAILASPGGRSSQRLAVPS